MVLKNSGDPRYHAIAAIARTTMPMAMRFGDIDGRIACLPSSLQPRYFLSLHFMTVKKFLSLLTTGAMSLSIVSVSAMSMEGDTMMKTDTMMKSDDAMMMKKDMMKTMTREERLMKAKERAKMRAAAQRMRWEEKAKMMKDQGMMKKDMMKKDEGTMMKSGDAMKKDAMIKEEVMMKAGEYKDSTASVLLTSVLSDGKTKVLFFHAGWCPVCKTANTTLASWYGTGEGLLTTYKINYDTEKSLKQTYGVTYQHTFVKVDGQGKLIKLLQSPSDEDLKNLLKM